MLKNQDAVPEQPVSVSQARVTPDELTTALAAIEARKQAEASRLAGTIPIDQAISDLHLDSTPDEIWNEVQKQREKATATAQEPPNSAQAAPVQPLGALLSGLQSASEARKRRNEALRVRFRPWWIGGLAPALLIWVMFQVAGSPVHVLTRLLPHSAPAAAPILRPLASVPDGQEVYADDSALIQISEGKPAAQVVVSQNETGNRWPMLKRDGHVYLRGYIASMSSLQPLAGKAVNVYNDDNSGELDGQSTSQITLRADKVPLQKSGGDDGYSEVTVSNFQPDPLTTLSPWH